MPGWLLRYPLATSEYVQRVSAPVALFHGDHDEVRPYQSSGRLRVLLKPGDQIVAIRGGGHDGLLEWSQYQQAVRSLL